MIPCNKLAIFSYLLIVSVAILTLFYFWDFDLQPRKECYCRGSDFCYRPLHRINRKSVHGKGIQFDCSLKKYIRGLEKFTDFNASTPILDNEPVILTYASPNHFDESKKMLIAWKKAKLGRKIVFYSLRLSDEQKQELRAICDLEIRELDFRAYPSHIFNLLNYAFKVVAIVDAYLDFDFFHVMDASIRPNNVTLLREYWDDVLKGNVPPFSMSAKRNFTTIQYTHFGTYAYLPILADLIDSFQFAGGILVVKRDKFTTELLKWAILCALTPDCISPIGAYLHCGKGQTHCHRYDQSVFNILYFNAVQENPKWNKIIRQWPYTDSIKVKRGDGYKGQFRKICCV